MWLSVDPLVSQSPDIAPYHFVRNNPIYYVDPDGNKEWPSYAAYKEALGTNALSEEDMWREGHWLRLDRGGVRTSYMGVRLYTSRAEAFNRACAINTYRGASGEYISLPQRQAYYGWANEFFSTKGYEVRWMGSAEKIVSELQLALTTPADLFGSSNEEVRQFINTGNKAILDDMMPRIAELVEIGPLTGDEAKAWDANALATEQNLIQPLYESLSPESIQILQDNIELKYGSMWEGNILNVEDRWRFGMRLMGYDVTNMKMPNLSE